MKNVQYKELIKEINKLDTQKDKMDIISKYILGNVKYNYLSEDNRKINEFFSKVDQSLFSTSEVYNDKEYTESMIYSLCDKLGLSADYRMKMNKKYENLIDANVQELVMFDFLPSIKVSPVYNNKLLKEGVAVDIAQFTKKICDDCLIPCEIVSTKENPNHVWNIVEINGEKLNYDFTYAIFARDQYNSIDMMAATEKWLGVPDENMADLYAVRKINEEKI